MRTTIALDDHLLASAKRRARERGETLGQVVENALRRELTEPAAVESPEVPVFRGGGGPLPGIDLTSNRALREALDRGVELDALR
jgi:Bacterial antitoxin of type II TA system, VapB